MISKEYLINVYGLHLTITILNLSAISDRLNISMNYVIGFDSYIIE